MKKIFIVAEIAQAHDGSIGILHSLVEALGQTGVDAIKFQTHLADFESSPLEPFRVPFSYVDKTRFDYWKRMELTPDQWSELRTHCGMVGTEFMSSPFSCAAVGLLERLGVQRYKVGSGEITNTLLLDRIASTRKPVILSSGMSDLAELEAAYRFLQMREIDVSVLECTSTYPTPADEIRLRNIPWLRERFQCPVGLSDHSGTPWPSLGAVAMGAEVLEFHVTFDKRMFGPDASSSLTINETKKLVDGVRFLEKSLAAEPGKELSPTVARLKPIFEKTLCVTEPTKAGTPIRLEILDAKKPADQGIPASRYREVIGRRARLNLEAFQFITWEDLA